MLKVKELATHCETSKSITLNVPPTQLAAPIASAIVQPKFTEPQGIIQITSPIGPKYEYSINSVSFQLSPIFINLKPGIYSIMAKEISTGCNTQSLLLTVDSIQSVPVASNRDFNSVNGITIYPNPTKGVFTIKGLSPTKKNKVEIYAIDGKLIYRITSQAINEIIDITNQQAGVYLLKINGESLMIVKK